MARKVQNKIKTTTQNKIKQKQKKKFKRKQPINNKFS